MKASTKKLHAAAVTGTQMDARAWDRAIEVRQAKHALDIAELRANAAASALAAANEELATQKALFANARAAARIDRGRA